MEADMPSAGASIIGEDPDPSNASVAESSSLQPKPPSPPNSHKQKSAGRASKRSIMVGGNRVEAPAASSRHNKLESRPTGARRGNIPSSDWPVADESPVSRNNMKVLDKDLAARYDFGDPILELQRHSGQAEDSLSPDNPSVRLEPPPLASNPTLGSLTSKIDLNTSASSPPVSSSA